MCGRVKLEGDFSQLKTAFNIPDDYPAPNYAPSWNVAPTDSLPIVRYNAKDGHRALDLMRWGLVPYWAKHIKVSFANINAMAETVDTKPAFKAAFGKRRCLVPIEAFYEWKKLGPKEKQPYAIALAGGGISTLRGNSFGYWSSQMSSIRHPLKMLLTMIVNPLTLGCMQVALTAWKMIGRAPSSCSFLSISQTSFLRASWSVICDCSTNFLSSSGL